MKVKVQIWHHENPEPQIFEATGEEFWAGAGSGYAYVGEVDAADIKTAAYGEAIYIDGEDFPVQQQGQT